MTGETEILGGVSPLKKRRGGRRQSSRGGQYAGKATSTASRRGGFAKSTGKRGAGGTVSYTHLTLPTNREV